MTQASPPRRSNRVPVGDCLALDDLGLAGARVRIENLFASMHGIDDEALARCGLSMTQLARHRADFVRMLVGIVLDEGVDSSRTSTRMLAMRLLGHLRLVEGTDALVEVLLAAHEPPVARVAAAESLGSMGAANVETFLVNAFEDREDQVTRAIARTLIARRSEVGRAAIEALRSRTSEPLASQLDALLDPDAASHGTSDQQPDRLELELGPHGIPTGRVACDA